MRRRLRSNARAATPRAKSPSAAAGRSGARDSMGWTRTRMVMIHPRIAAPPMVIRAYPLAVQSRRQRAVGATGRDSVTSRRSGAPAGGFMLEVGGLRGFPQVCRMTPAGAGIRASALSDGAAEPSDEGATRRMRRGGAFFRTNMALAERCGLPCRPERSGSGSRGREGIPAGRGSFAPSCFRRLHPDRTPGPLGGIC